MSDPKNFYLRLKQACDDNRLIPEKGAGRQVWLAKKLHVSEEAVRKWFTGEARPRVDKMDSLAALLGVDSAWLSLGVSPELTRVEQRVWSETAEGLVYVVMGFFMVGGASCAFPTKNDPRGDAVDFYAILKGQQLAVHVSAAREISKGTYVMPIPRQYESVYIVGGVPNQATNADFISMPHILIERHKKRKGSAFEVIVTKNAGEFISGDDVWPKLKKGLVLMSPTENGIG